MRHIEWGWHVFRTNLDSEIKHNVAHSHVRIVHAASNRLNFVLMQSCRKWGVLICCFVAIVSIQLMKSRILHDIQKYATCLDSLSVGLLSLVSAGFKSRDLCWNPGRVLSNQWVEKCRGIHAHTHLSTICFSNTPANRIVKRQIWGKVEASCHQLFVRLSSKVTLAHTAPICGALDSGIIATGLSLDNTCLIKVDTPSLFASNRPCSD